MGSGTEKPLKCGKQMIWWQRMESLNALCSGSQDFSTRSAHSSISGLSCLTWGLCSGWDHFMKMFILKIRNQEEMSIFTYGFIQLLEVVGACSPLPFFLPSDTDCCISPSPRPHSVRLPGGAALWLSVAMWWSWFYCHSITTALNNHRGKNLWFTSCSFVLQSKCTGLASHLMCPLHQWRTQPQVAKGCDLSVCYRFIGLARKGWESPTHQMLYLSPLGNHWLTEYTVNENTGNVQGKLCSVLHKGWGRRRGEGFWRLCAFLLKQVFKCL